jgi:hypothetical protein
MKTNTACAALASIFVLLGCSAEDRPRNESVGREAQALPSGWSVTALGSSTPCASGVSYNPANGTFTVTGVGDDGMASNWDLSEDDDACFVHTGPLQGDVEIVVRIASLTHPSGKDMGQVGVNIRETLSAQSLMGAGAIQVGGDYPEHQQFVSARNGSINAGAHTIVTNEAPAPKWLRLQRIGKDFSVAWRKDGETLWRPLSPMGGDFAPASAYLGFFVSNLKAPAGQVVATFDNVYVGPPRMGWESSWLGSSYAQFSTGAVSHDATTLHVGIGVGATPRVYKHSPWVEGGANLQVFNGNTGAPEKIPGFPTRLAEGLAQGAFTGDDQYIYTATGPLWTGPYCIERRDRLSLLMPPNEDACDCVGGACDWDDPNRRITRPGGMAALKRSATDRRLYVTEPNRDGVPGSSWLFELRPTTVGGISRLRIRNEYPVPARPSAVAAAHDQVWVVHAATDFQNAGNYDVKYTPSIACYSATTGAPCSGITGSASIRGCTATITSHCVENPTALAIAPGTSLATAKLYVADNGRARQNIRIFTSLNSAVPQETGTIGVNGGVYSGPNSGSVYDAANGGWARLYNPIGVSVDSAGAVYVASNGLPGLDIRKFALTGGQWQLAWKTLGLSGRRADSEVVSFDTNGSSVDAYAFNKRYALDVAATSPADRWPFKGLTWDPLLTDERNEEGLLARSFGSAHVRRIGSQRFLLVAAVGDDSKPYPSALGPLDYFGWPVTFSVYRFQGDIAVPAAVFSYRSVDVNPLPVCDKDGDCINDAGGSTQPVAELSLWVDSPAAPNGRRDPGESTSTPSIDCYVNPACPTSQSCFCPVQSDCGYTNAQGVECEDIPGGGNQCTDQNACRSAHGCELAIPGGLCDVPCVPLDPFAQNSTCSSAQRQIGWAPDARGMGGVELDRWGNVWVVNGGKLWRFTNLNTAGGVRYALGSRTLVPLSAGTPQDVRVDVTGTGTLFVYTGGSVDVYRDAFAGTPTLQFSVPLDSSSPITPLDSCPPKAFDVAGDPKSVPSTAMIFVSHECGPVRVYSFANGGSPTPVAMLYPGPELSGEFIYLQKDQSGIRAGTRPTPTGLEYLISTTDVTGAARTIMYRWKP